MRELRSLNPISFSQLRDNGPIFKKFGREDAIFEQFYAGTDPSCNSYNGLDN
jgi:hypothetical protein